MLRVPTGLGSNGELFSQSEFTDSSIMIMHGENR